MLPAELNTTEFKVERMTDGKGISNLVIILDEAIADIYIGSVLLVAIVNGNNDPIKVKVVVDKQGKPIPTNIKSCIVVEYIY